MTDSKQTKPDLKNIYLSFDGSWWVLNINGVLHRCELQRDVFQVLKEQAGIEVLASDEWVILEEISQYGVQE